MLVDRYHLLRLRYQGPMAPKGKGENKAASSSGLPAGKGKCCGDGGGEGGSVLGGSASAGPVRERSRSPRRWRELRRDSSPVPAQAQLRVRIMTESCGSTLTDIFH